MMAEQNRSKNPRKARRGGFSLAMGYRLLQKQSETRQGGNHARNDEHGGRGRKPNLDVGKQQDNNQRPASGLQASKFNGDATDQNDEYNEEEATMLLDRFRAGHTSRPNSSQDVSGESRDSAVSINPLKRPAHAISRGEPEQNRDASPLRSVEGNVFSRNRMSPLSQPTAPLNEPSASRERQTMNVTENGVSSVKSQDSQKTQSIIPNGHPKKVLPTRSKEISSGPSRINNTTMTPIPGPTSPLIGMEHGCSADPSFTSPRKTQHQVTNGQTSVFSRQPTTNLDMKPRMRNTRDRSPSESPPHSPPGNRPLRRSARSRAGPTNYYAPPPGFHGHGKDDGLSFSAIPSEVDEKDEEEDEQFPQPTHRPQRKKAHLVYNSDTIRITQEPLSDVKGECNHRIPYCSFERRQALATYCAQGDFGKVESGDLLHKDFTFAEINALCTLLGCPCGSNNNNNHSNNRDNSDDDTAVPSHVAKLVWKHCSTRTDVAVLAARIRLLCNLNEALAPRQCELASLLIDIRAGDFSRCLIDDCGIRKAWKYLCDILDVKGPRNGKPHFRLQNLLETVEEERVHCLGEQCKQAVPLNNRNRKDVRNFLFDANDKLLPLSPVILRAISTESKEYETRSQAFDTASPTALLRSRELGRKFYRDVAPIGQVLRSERQFELYKSWTGASNDVVVLSWSPDGTRFAAGAVAQSDEQNMQYNRNNNLLLGDLVTNKLKELPDHRIPRPQSGPNATVDPNLYMSVSAMKWCGNRLYTASYDQTVKVWDVSRHCDTTCTRTLRHAGKVQVMAVSDFDSQIVATGSEANSNSSFMLWSVPESGYACSSSLELLGCKDFNMTPTSLSWGSTPSSKDLLVAGMSGRDSERGDPAKSGHLALWQIAEAKAVPRGVAPYSLNVFDISWHPLSSVFATASSVPSSARSKGVQRDTRSLVRLYDSSQPSRISRTVVQEYECPALDINDVTFCPFNPNYVTASCTDGSTYVWDDRKPNTILHRLKHGPPIQELDSSLTREQADVGIRLALWGNGINQFYSGSSDGVLKSWNILSATEDALTANVASLGQGIMSGAFSTDKNNILIGDACGGMHIFSNAPWSRSEGDGTSMVFESATCDRVCEEVGEGAAGEDMGERQREANKLLASGELMIHPEFGPGQGPNYYQYYAAWARPPGTVDLANTPLNPEIQAQQLWGPPVPRRAGLDKATREHVELQIQLARSRNGRAGALKGEQEHCYSSSYSHNGPCRPEPSDIINEEEFEPGMNFIDLTQSDDDEAIAPAATSTFSTPDSFNDETAPSPSEWLEEDNWWPINVDPNFDGDGL